MDCIFITVKKVMVSIFWFSIRAKWAVDHITSSRAGTFSLNSNREVPDPRRRKRSWHSSTAFLSRVMSGRWVPPAGRGDRDVPQLHDFSSSGCGTGNMGYSTRNINFYISILSYCACILHVSVFPCPISYRGNRLYGFCVYRVSGFAFIRFCVYLV